MMNLLRFLGPVIIGGIIYNMPPPEGMDPQGWQLLAIFVGTIIGLILKPLPLGAVALMSMAITVLTGTLKLEPEMLSGYGSSVIWLVVFVFFIARGFIKTQLGTRMAFQFVQRFGRKPLGLAYSIVGTELLIAPFIPSIAARAGGIMYPVVKSISEALGSKVEDGTHKKLGSFLFKTAYNGNVITSAMFATAMASNPMIQSFAAVQGIDISWMDWAVAAIVPGLLSLILVPLFLYIVYPPEIKQFDSAAEVASARLQAMGPMSRKEWMMAGIFLLMLVCWIFDKSLNIQPTTTALVGVCLLLLSRIITWDDILAEKEAWHTLIWFAILVTMAKYLQIYGVISWFSSSVEWIVGGMEWPVAFGVLLLVYFYSHYLFASNTSHISAMYATFLAVAIAVKTPPLYAALALGFCSNLFASLTHYASSTSPIFFGAGYVPIGTWWRLGFLVSLVNLIIWFGAGSLWWKALGIW